MGLTETEALVLRTYNLAEADKIVVCLTRDAGLVRGVAKGSRRIKNRFGAALEPFTILNLAYHHKENQELVSLRTVEIVKSHFNLFRDPHALAGLAYMGDLILDFCPPHQVNDKLFRMVKACLSAVEEEPQDLQLVLRYFEIWVLRLEGFLPDLRRCGSCGSPLSEAATIFIDRDTGLICRQCAEGKGEVLSSILYAQMCATKSLSPQLFAAQSRDLSARLQREFSDLTHRMITRVLERRPRMQSTLQPMDRPV
jgi:DNA repair protein RecO (recombination protein O)